MAQFYSLEEAARLLGMSADELKAKAQSRDIRAFQDRGTWQFRRGDIDEMARRRGLGSDPDLSLSDLDLEIPPDSDDDVLNLNEYQAGGRTDSGERDMLLDDLSVPPPLTGSSSTIIGMKPTGKQPSDSDVKVVPNQGSRGASDSDVRLAPHSRPSDSDVTLVAEDSSDFPTPRPGAKTPVFDPGETTLRPSPMLGSSGEVRAVGGTDESEVDSDSDFELTPSSVIDALQPDSGSDFELTALDASDEFEAAAPRSPSDSDVTNALAPSSGVNLGRPTDSGINLLGGTFDLGSEDSIELAPLEDDEPARPAAKPSKPAASLDPGATSLPIKDPGATALPIKNPGATALPIRSSAEKDIFEDTDFEVDALESKGEDRTMQLEATSDFDLEDSDSSISEVFAVDEEDVDQNAATAMAAAPSFESDDDSAEEEAAWDSIADEAVASTPSSVSTPSARPASPMLSSSAQPEWGTPWVVALGLATFVLLIAAFVGMDMVSNLNEFRGDGPAYGLVKAVAGMMGGG
jgi:hypothetical protein